ncbi:hypothetical protein BDD14_5632 [Edaphobacter modestus]|uniref:Uncharacterized protein n=1 Tax=Edaphobacter modestus TaxID=388466 RepID=A0A4Q7YGQ8_9BACT|nr:hypothetical protein BDD14_5632 [Edaphobacter modestus]
MLTQCCFNLRRDNLLLQAFQNQFPLINRQPHGGRGDLVRALDCGNLMLDGFTWYCLNNQLHRPFHAASLSHPTTLHALTVMGQSMAIHSSRLCVSVSPRYLPFMGKF